MTKTINTRNMVFAAVFAALISAVSPFLIPIGPIPITLATLMIYLAASVLDWRFGTLSVLVYVLIGVVGVPVFAGFTGGPQKLVGPSGGFILGYIVCALIIGVVLAKLQTRKWAYPVAMVLGTVGLYIVGTVWFMIVMKASLAKALTLCVLPFLIIDGVKIVIVSILAPILRKRLQVLFPAYRAG